MILAILQLPLSSFFNDSFVAKEEKKIPLALPSKHRAFFQSLTLSSLSLLNSHTLPSKWKVDLQGDPSGWLKSPVD